MRSQTTRRPFGGRASICGVDCYDRPLAPLGPYTNDHSRVTLANGFDLFQVGRRA
jgi:hypothetical protein